MPTPLRRRIRLARRSLVYGVAVALVLIAVLLGALSQVLPMAERHPQRVAAWLSQRAGQPVAFDRIDTAWTRRGPLLRLDNLRIGNGAQSFVIGDTEMMVSIYAGLLPGHPFSELRLRGLDLTLQRTDDGRWQVRGLPGQQQAGGDPMRALERLGELQVIGGKLAVQALGLGIDARVEKIDLRLQVLGDRVRAGARIWARKDVAPLDAALDFDRKRGDGRAYAVAARADVAAWSALTRMAGVIAESGHGRAEAWAELRGHRVSQVTTVVALDGVGLRGRADGSSPASIPRVRFERVEARARWRLVDGGWRFDAPRLRIGSGAQLQTLDGLMIAGGERYALHADRIDAGPLFAVAALSDRMAPGLRQWVKSAQPRASLQDIDLAGKRGGPMRAKARIASFGFAAVGNSPGVLGLAGDLQGDADGFMLRLDPRSAMTFNWPRGFGVAHTVHLTGLVSGWREGNGWRIGTPALRIKSDTLGVTARGGMWWQGDGSRPWMDLAADIDETAVPVAKGFWVRNKMAATVVQWLVDALLDGRVQNGRAIVTGDLDDWPFVAHDGRFEASAHLAGTALKFQPGWPAADSVEGDVRFVADGFDLTGKGRLLGVELQQLQAGIDHYRDGDLTVKAQGGGDAAQLLTLLRQSPLYATYRDTFDNLSALGAAKVGFDLDLPLRHGEHPRIGGSVELKDARLTERRWKLDFDRVNGRAEYSQGGFRADNLRVLHEGHPGELALRAGDFTRDKNHVFEAGLDAMFGADALLDRAPEMAWLKPHMEGQSSWTVGVLIPRAAPGKEVAALLQLRSSLVGTELTLPEPLRKPAGEALATSVETPLPMGSGDILVNLGQRIAVRARSTNGQTGVRIALGSARVDEAAPAHGLVATGRAQALDAIDWIALMHGGEGDGLPLQRIDVVAQKLNLLGGAFADTRVIVVPASRGATAVQTEGESLEGALLIPAGEGATIAGRFDRFHWRAPSGADASPATGTASTDSTGASATAPTDPFNPAKIPPLAIDFTDLRVADAKLGSARLRTRPTVNGLHIDQLQTRADKQRIDVTGDWTGRGANASTRLDIRIGSEDLGALMGGFGMSNRLGGGEGTMQFDAGWTGSPATFNLATLEGSLVMDIRNGRLLEVEPGAGRVLGLLSLAQLPRRLMLDFRDFFSKGFAFNQAGGRVDFSGGMARTEQLTIDGPAAAIGIHGTANLRAQSFDQTIEVRPKAGNLLTVAGAIAAGPVGAAIGAAANAVLQKPLGQMASRTYRVTGPWKEPKVEVIGSEQSRASQVPDEPPPG